MLYIVNTFINFFKFFSNKKIKGGDKMDEPDNIVAEFDKWKRENPEEYLEWCHEHWYLF